jgi:hypothetical protein
MAINIPSNTPALNVAIIRRAQRDIPIMENPVGSNRSPEIDALCKRYGVPLGSSWCALWLSAVWEDSGAEIPPVDDSKGWHPAKAETWRQWAIATGRLTHTPSLGCAAVFGNPGHHVAACVVSTTPFITDLEGNTSETGFSREGELTELKRTNLAGLFGYISPTPVETSE